jgi:hypothetical protein
MAIIDPDGLFEGERLAKCSDVAQLYWQRLFIASNGYGRLELSYRSILSKAFRHFKNPPSEEQLWSIFEELAENYLAILYESNGVWWAQFITNEKYLPRYKTVRDEESPSPPAELVDRARRGYLEWKRAKSVRHRFQKFSEISEKFPKISEGEERSGVGVGEGEGVGVGVGEGEGVGVGVGEGEGVGVGVGEGEGVGEERKAASRLFAEELAQLVDEIVCAHPKSRLRNLRRNEVRQVQQIAVLEAMRAEMQAKSCTEVQALRKILTRIQLLAEKVPKQEWRYFKDVPEFFRNHDDRIAPEEFTRGIKREAIHDHHKSNRAEAAVDSVLASTRAALARIPGLDRHPSGGTGGDDG